MCQLLQASRNGRPTSIRDKNIATKHEWALPFVVVAALREAFSLESEYFASHLNVHPGTTQFWTVNEADSAFLGARFNAFSVPWHGAGLATPEFEDATLLKAV